MGALPFTLHAAGVLAPGLGSLAQLRALARDEAVYASVPLDLPGPPQLPPNERRRASQAVRLALACITQALEGSGFAAAGLRPVFATDEGTGEVCQQMLEALATTGQISPLLFTNSVHNAPSGYFSIAWRNHEPASVVSLGLESFACGLACAVTDAMASRRPVLLVVSDPALAPPMTQLLPVHESTATAWILSAGAAPEGAPVLGRFALDVAPAEGPPSALPAWIPAAWSGHSSAFALAALGLLDAPAQVRMRLGWGGQQVVLWREGEAP